MRTLMTILKDTRVSHSLMRNCLQHGSTKGKHVPSRGISRTTVNILFHWICLSSDLQVTSGSTDVGVVPRLLMQGISMLLGNEVVGGKAIIPSHAKPGPGISKSRKCCDACTSQTERSRNGSWQDEKCDARSVSNVLKSWWELKKISLRVLKEKALLMLSLL